MRQQPRIHKCRRRPQPIAERPLAWPFEHRIREEHKSPPIPHPPVEYYEILRRLGLRLSHQQDFALGQFWWVGDADRDHAVARLQRLQRRRSHGLQREILAE